VNTLQFANSGYTINNNLNSVVAELNSTFGNGKFSNKAQASYSGFRDKRDLPSDTFFPQVDITQGGTTYTSIGTEQFSANNLLEQNIYQFTDNLSYFAGAHIFTAGVNYERFNFVNGFNLQRYGYPYFGGIDIATFLRTLDQNDPLFKRNPFSRDANGQFSPLDLNAVAAAGGQAPIKQVDVTVAQLGLYVQDEYQVNPALKLTLGVRADMPIYSTDVAPNPQISDATFQNSNGQPVKVDVSEFPSSKPLFSPRLGFNYTSQGDGAKTQVRGGTGIFTGRIPFVWISKQASNARDAHAAPNWRRQPRYLPISWPAPQLLQRTQRPVHLPRCWRDNAGKHQPGIPVLHHRAAAQGVCQRFLRHRCLHLCPS
jgi:outer membrane receptor protein involved in Fe transport